MSLVLHVLALLLMLAGAGSAAGAERHAGTNLDRLFEIGREYYESGEWAEALRIFQGVLRYDPAYAEAAMYIALIERHRLQGVAPPHGQTRQDAIAQAMASAPQVPAPSPPLPVPAPPAPPAAAAPEPAQSTAPEATPAFRTYVVRKSSEELAEERTQEALAERAQAPPPEPAGIPDSARPTVELRNTVSYSWLDPRTGPPDRQMVLSTSGHAGEFDVIGELSRKDRAGTFRHDYTYLDFIRPDLFIGLFDQTTGLAPLRGQTDELFGVKIRKAWNDRHATTAAAGWTENTVSGRLGSGMFLGSLYEVQEEVAPADWLKLRTAAFYTEHDADLEALRGTGDIPRRNVVTFGEAVVTPWRQLALSAQAAHARYDPDDDPDAHVADSNWRGEAAWTGAHGQLRYAYEFVGDEYASVGNPAVYQDFAGWNVSGGYRLTNHWSVFGNVSRFRDNVSDDPAAVTQQSQAWTVSTHVALPLERSMTLSFTDALGDPRGVNASTSSRSRLTRVDYIRPFFFDTRLLVNYQFTATTQPAGSNADAHDVGGSLFKGFPGGSSLFLSQSFRADSLETDQDALTATTSFTANYQLRRDLGLYLNTGYTRNAVEGGTPGVDTLSGSAGMRVDLFRDTTLTAEYRLSSYDLDTELGDRPRNWSIFLLVSQRFGVATRPNFGLIEGRVGQDMDHDGTLDPGEPGVEGLTLRLPDARTAVTAADGRFAFSRVAPSALLVRVDPADLPIGWALPEPQQKVVVGRRERARADFALVQVAAIEGRVFIDESGDGAFQEQEEPLEGIAVILLPGEQFRRTDGDGAFRFDDLLPGRYEACVHAEDLPTGYGLRSAPALAVEVEAGEERTDLGFAVELLR